MSEPFLWRVDYDAKRGRLLRATRDVKTGQCVLCERAYGNVILSTYRAALCAVCLRAAAADICCDDCSTVFFCSEECRAALQDVHEKECEALKDVDLTAAKTKTDVDLLRLLIRILAARSLDAADGKLQADDEGIVRASYANVKNLVHVLDKEGGLWVDHVRAGARKIMENLPGECHLPVEKVVVLAAQINENSYSLDALDETHLVAAVGLILEVRALRDINEGEELTLSYINIDVERDERREELRKTKHFNCRCERCAALLSESFDVPRTVMASAVLTVRAKLASAKQYLNQFSSCPGRYHLLLALAHFDYAEALRRMLVDPTIPVSENSDRNELQREMRASYQAFSDICAVCLGKPHPLRYRAAACLKY
ncbi:unnamed protein product [Peronospora destructor]|uniref:SET domain-containing protein n=1 Tax=Peronospora destructor TaxID=86335 RepID=A0AAV0UG67_9STRA|nr:unnamed protein product [Peronospora destructor]